jgi:hypothetical protein
MMKTKGKNTEWGNTGSSYARTLKERLRSPSSDVIAPKVSSGIKTSTVTSGIKPTSFDDFLRR